MKNTSLPKLIAAIGIMTAMIPLHQAAAQGALTVPDKGTGGPEAVDLKPKLTQADPTEKIGAVVRTDLTIPEIVSGAVDFTTLSGALQAAGLEEKLKAEGPFTLIAPNNDAFAALPKGVLTALMKPENVEALRKVLTYHVIPKKLKADEMVPGDYTTSGGEILTVSGHANDMVSIQESGFGVTDVMAKNGVIHAVDSVLVPPTVNIEDYIPAKATGESE